MNYRRSRITNGTFFFTVVTHDRRKILCYGENVELIKCVFKKVSQVHPFKIDALVLLPDHFLLEGDNEYSMRMRLIKSYFSRECDDQYKTRASDSRKKKQEQMVWQRRFWEHQIRDEKDYEAHVNYIHYNPVKHGYVKSPKDWRYSTFHKFVEKGVYKIDWGASENINFEVRVGKE